MSSFTTYLSRFDLIGIIGYASMEQDKGWLLFKSWVKLEQDILVWWSKKLKMTLEYSLMIIQVLYFICKPDFPQRAQSITKNWGLTIVLSSVETQLKLIN